MAASDRAPKTNGAIISFIGRNKIRDDQLLTLISILCPPHFIFQLMRGLWSGRTIREQLFQVFSLNTWSLSLQPSIINREPPPPSRYHKMLRFVCISDTHMQHESINLPPGDVLVHCGDFTNHGTLLEVSSFAKWFKAQPHKYKVVLSGNHDMIMDQQYHSNYWSDWNSDFQSHEKAVNCFLSSGNEETVDKIDGDRDGDGDGSCGDIGKLRNSTGTSATSTNNNGSSCLYLLSDSGITIEGIQIFGSPWVPHSHSWLTAFNKPSGDMPDHWEKTLPAGRGSVDVLLTHTPAYGALDRDTDGTRGGCPALAKAIQKLQPSFHVFGHEHSDYGIQLVPFALSETETGTEFKAHRSSTSSSSINCMESSEIHGTDGTIIGRTHCVAINASSVSSFYRVGARQPIVFDIPALLHGTTTCCSSPPIDTPTTVN